MKAATSCCASVSSDARRADWTLPANPDWVQDVPMEQTAVLALLLAAVVAFLAPAPRRFIEIILHRRPAWILAAPPLFTAVFTVAAALAGASSLPLALLILAYTAAPTPSAPAVAN